MKVDIVLLAEETKRNKGTPHLKKPVVWGKSNKQLEKIKLSIIQMNYLSYINSFVLPVLNHAYKILMPGICYVMMEKI